MNGRLHQRWSEMAVDHPMEGVDRRRVMGELVMISHVTLPEGCHVALHSHDNEQMTMVVSSRTTSSFSRVTASESLEPQSVQTQPVLSRQTGCWPWARS